MCSITLAQSLHGPKRSPNRQNCAVAVTSSASFNLEMTIAEAMARCDIAAHRRARLPTALRRALQWSWLGFWLLLAWGCSSHASRQAELPQGRSPSLLSPQQCEANAAIAKAAMEDATSLIEPGDQLAINFYLSPEFNTKVTVGPDGNISLPVAGVVRAAGLTPGHLAALLDQAYRRELRNPNATVHILGTPGRQIYVGGEVAHPGAFPLLPGMTVLQAISTAGGFGEYAKIKKVVLVRRDACGVAHSETLNLKTALTHPDNGQDVALVAHDLLVVTPKKVKDTNLWVRHYMQNMMPVPFEPYMVIPP